MRPAAYQLELVYYLTGVGQTVARHLPLMRSQSSSLSTYRCFAEAQ